ncbi:MAG: XTP/dITP diphosphatase [Armatimonadetes bacterium]|nr:XTP/dITP diphosphatase [Armatimonadota bacterium]
MKKLVVATKNVGKVQEIVDALADLPFEVVSLQDYPDAPDVEETGASFAENAILKAVAYADFTGELTLADDSGLEVDALDGAPGVFSSRYAPTVPQRNAKLLDAMKNVPDDRRAARFRCVVAIVEPGGTARTCEDSVEGVVSREPAGTGGFGYDPIFYIPSLGKSMAELSFVEKNAISHRGKALKKARKLLTKNI